MLQKQGQSRWDEQTECPVPARPQCHDSRGTGAATTMKSSVYGSVVFDLTLFNEVTRTDHVIRNIKASVIDSCIEVIVRLPDIRSQRLIHLIPSYFDTPDPAFFRQVYHPPGIENSKKVLTRTVSTNQNVISQRVS